MGSLNPSTLQSKGSDFRGKNLVLISDTRIPRFKSQTLFQKIKGRENSIKLVHAVAPDGLQYHHLICIILLGDDELLFKAELTEIRAESETCSSVPGGQFELEAFRVDLVLLKDTPEMSGDYTVTMVAKVNN